MNYIASLKDKVNSYKTYSQQLRINRELRTERLSTVGKKVSQDIKEGVKIIIPPINAISEAKPLESPLDSLVR